MIATKGGLVRPGVTPGEWPRVGDPNYLGQCVRMSLRPLKIERIDLWQLHRIDGKVPQDEQFGAIREFIDQGFIRHAGLSQVTVDQIEAARKVFPVATVQNRYNLADRADEAVLDYCEANGIGFIPWFPLAAGDLAKPGGAVDTLAKAQGRVSLCLRSRRLISSRDREIFFLGNMASEYVYIYKYSDIFC